MSSPWTRLASCILVSGLALRAGDAGVDTVGDQGHVGHGAVAHHDAQGLPVHVRRHAPLEAGRDVRAVGTDVVEDFAAGRFAAGAGFGRVDLAHGHAVGAFGHAFAALADELEGFEDLVQAHRGAGVDAAAVMGDALELQVGIGRIGRILAHVDGDAGTARHGAHNAQAQGVFLGQQAQALGTAQDHGVGGIDLADLVHGGLHLVDHAQDVLEHVRGHVALDAADAVGGQVHAVAVHGLLHVLHHLAHFHDVHEQRLEADDVGLDGGVEQVRGHALDLFGQHAQVAGTDGDLHAQHVFHGHAVGEAVAVGAQGADALGQGDVLDEVALGGYQNNPHILSAIQ